MTQNQFLRRLAPAFQFFSHQVQGIVSDGIQAFALGQEARWLVEDDHMRVLVNDSGQHVRTHEGQQVRTGPVQRKGLALLKRYISLNPRAVDFDVPFLNHFTNHPLRNIIDTAADVFRKR